MEGGDRSQQAGTTRCVMHVPNSKVRGPCAHLPHLDREESTTVEWGHISSLLCFFKSYLIKKTLFTESWRCQASRPRCRHGRPSEADAQADVSEDVQAPGLGNVLVGLATKGPGVEGPPPGTLVLLKHQRHQNATLLSPEGATGLARGGSRVSPGAQLDAFLCPN